MYSKKKFIPDISRCILLALLIMPITAWSVSGAAPPTAPMVFSERSRDTIEGKATGLHFKATSRNKTETVEIEFNGKKITIAIENKSIVNIIGYDNSGNGVWASRNDLYSGNSIFLSDSDYSTFKELYNQFRATPDDSALGKTSLRALNLLNNWPKNLPIEKMTRSCAATASMCGRIGTIYETSYCYTDSLVAMDNGASTPCNSLDSIIYNYQSIDALHEIGDANTCFGRCGEGCTGLVAGVSATNLSVYTLGCFMHDDCTERFSSTASGCDEIFTMYAVSDYLCAPECTLLKLCNKTNNEISVAYGYNDNEASGTKLVTQGWFFIDPNNCIFLDAHGNNTIYYYATNSSGSASIYEWSGSTLLCSDNSTPFQINSADTNCPAGASTKGFIKLSFPSPGSSPVVEVDLSGPSPSPSPTPAPTPMPGGCPQATLSPDLKLYLPNVQFTPSSSMSATIAYDHKTGNYMYFKVVSYGENPGNSIQSGCPQATLSSNNVLSIPSLQYTPTAGSSMNLWTQMNFKQVGNDMYLEVGSYGVNP